MKRFDTGVFLPNAKNGFTFSTAAPSYDPSYQTILDITLLAEEIGLDYVFSMAKWRGFGGSTEFWDASLESFSLMSALAAATARIKLIATVTPLLFHPALMAKMSATLDNVSGGRLGLNIVTGAILKEYAQMGVLPPGYDKNRYAYATEWVGALKRLWTEPSVTYDGDYFHLEDCISEPKPLQKPYPFLVCAAASDEGLRFTAREVDYAFISEDSIAKTKEKALRAKLIAAEEGTTVKTQVLTMLVIGETNADAETYLERLIEGADLTALTHAGRSLSGETRVSTKERGAALLADGGKIVLGLPIVGGPTEVAHALIDLAVEGDVDGVLLCFPDFIRGLRQFGSDVMPILANHLDVGLKIS